MRSITKALSLLAGVRPDAMTRAPGALHQSATTGLIMLLTATIATLTMGYALQREFLGDRFALVVAVGGGLLWGAFILALDRLLLLGLNKLAPWYEKLLQLLLRLPIAIVLGVAISKPVILRVSETILARNLRDERLAMVAADRKGHADNERLDEKRTDAATLAQKKEAEEQRANGDPDSSEYKDAKSDLAASERRYRTVLNANNARIARARRQAEALELSDNPADQNRANVLRETIARWRTENAHAAEDVRAGQRRVDEAARQWRAAEKAKIEELTNSSAEAERDLAAADETVRKKTGESENEIAPLMVPNLINEYTTLQHIEATPNHPHARTLRRSELALDFLFILFEITPLLSKILSRTSAIDHAISAIELEDQERINQGALNNLARLQKIIEVSRVVDDTAIQHWATLKLNTIQTKPTMTTAALRDLRSEISETIA